MNRTPAPLFTFKRCLLLCLPALALALFVRLDFLHAIPEAAYDSDSNSYFELTERLYNKGEWNLSEKRRWVYPHFLLPLPMLPGNTLQAVAMIQHASGLIAIVGLGWIVGNLTRRREIWVPLATMAWAVWPRLLWFEHTLAAEAFFVTAFILAIAMALPFGALENRRRLFGFLFFAMLAAALKPHGRGIWMGCLLGAIVLLPHIRFWKWEHALIIFLGMAITFAPGNKLQSNWLLLSSVLPLVDTDNGKWPEYRKALKPAIDKVKDDPLQYPWKQGLYKKALRKPDPLLISPEWAQLIPDKKKYAIVAHDLAFSALKAHPLLYARMVVLKTGIAMDRSSYTDTMDPVGFWKEQISKNEDRWAREESIAEMKLLYELDYEGYKQFTAERTARHSITASSLSWLEGQLAWARSKLNFENHQWRLEITWMGALALIGLMCSFWPTVFRQMLPLLLSAAAYMLTVFAVGDSLLRYSLPLEWVAILFAVLAADRMVGGIERLAAAIFAKNSRQTPASA